MGAASEPVHCEDRFIGRPTIYNSGLPGVFMLVRLAVALLLLSSTSPAQAKNKKKQELPDVALNAKRVLVVIRPDAGEPVTSPMANRAVLDAVEKAISQWGRFDLVMDAQTADLVIAVRKGHAGGPVISNSPVDNRPIIFQPSAGGGRAGGQQGRPPDLTNPGLGPQDRGPRIDNQIGPSDDLLEVYLGGVEYPLDSAAIWRDSGKNALNGPAVQAVEQLRKAMEESEKQRGQKP
jgi:hypothetical protein